MKLGKGYLSGLPSVHFHLQKSWFILRLLSATFPLVGRQLPWFLLCELANGCGPGERRWRWNHMEISLQVFTVLRLSRRRQFMFIVENQTTESRQRKLGWEAQNRHRQRAASFPAPACDSPLHSCLVEPVSWYSCANRGLRNCNRILWVSGKRIPD